MQISRSHGAYLLARLGKRQDEIADRIGVSRAAVEHWLSGRHAPASKFRHAMVRAYRIPEHAWDEPIPRDPPKKRATAPREDEAPAPARVTAPIIEDASVRRRALDLARRVDELQEELDDENDESTPLERAKVLSSCAATLKLIGTLTGETLEIGETRVLKLAAWRRIQEVIARVLTPWPDALRLVGEELKRLGAEW